MSGINREAWLSALAVIDPPSDAEALTTAELGELFGLKTWAVKSRIRTLVLSGAATVTRKTFTDATGRRQTVAAYRLTKGGTDGADNTRRGRRRDARRRGRV